MGDGGGGLGEHALHARCHQGHLHWWAIVPGLASSQRGMAWRLSVRTGHVPRGLLATVLAGVWGSGKERVSI